MAELTARDENGKPIRAEIVHDPSEPITITEFKQVTIWVPVDIIDQETTLPEKWQRVRG